MMEVTRQSGSYSVILGVFHYTKTSEHYVSTFLHVKKYPTFYEVLQKKQRQSEKKILTKQKDPHICSDFIIFQDTTLIFLLLCSVFNFRLSNMWYTPKRISQK